MLEYHDPTWLVTRAWSVFRLPVLQGLIEGIIADLQRVEPAVAPTATTAVGMAPAGSPAHEALSACIAELRDASGMAEASARRAAHCEQVRVYMAREPAEWSERFGVALDEYRHRVSFALQTSFAASQLNRQS
jgi:hypothetical protein